MILLLATARTAALAQEMEQMIQPEANGDPLLQHHRLLWVPSLVVVRKTNFPLQQAAHRMRLWERRRLPKPRTLAQPRTLPEPHTLSQPHTRASLLLVRHMLVVRRMASHMLVPQRMLNILGFAYLCTLVLLLRDVPSLLQVQLAWRRRSHLCPVSRSTHPAHLRRLTNCQPVA